MDLLDLTALQPPTWHRIATQRFRGPHGAADWAEWRISRPDYSLLTGRGGLLERGEYAMVTAKIHDGYELLIAAVAPKDRKSFGIHATARRNERNWRR